MSRKRIFFALWPDDRQRDRLRDVISPLAKLVEGQVVYRGNWHVTTAFIGEFPERRLAELQGIWRLNFVKRDMAGLDLTTVWMPKPLRTITSKDTTRTPRP